MRQLIKVSRSKIKAQLDAERTAKKQRKAKKPSASDREADEKGRRALLRQFCPLALNR